MPQQAGCRCNSSIRLLVLPATTKILLCPVAGVTARQRKDELERLNEQLRKINTSLRKQARAGTIYAPGLTYIPAGARPPSC